MPRTLICPRHLTVTAMLAASAIMLTAGDRAVAETSGEPVSGGTSVYGPPAGGGLRVRRVDRAGLSVVPGARQPHLSQSTPGYRADSTGRRNTS